MKKIILLLLLVLVSITASARKSYITVYAHPTSNHYTISMNGDVPSGIPNVNYGTHGCYTSSDTYSIGEVLNILSEYGYEVELMTPNGDTSSFRVHYLLSKETSSGQTISKGDVNTDGEINIADVNEVISLILGMLRDNPKLLEQLGVEQPK